MMEDYIIQLRETVIPAITVSEGMADVSALPVTKKGFSDVLSKVHLKHASPSKTKKSSTWTPEAQSREASLILGDKGLTKRDSESSLKKKVLSLGGSTESFQSQDSEYLSNLVGIFQEFSDEIS
jgi:hypothetical protein